MTGELASVDLLIVAHELTHYATARTLGYRPRIGLRGRYVWRFSVRIAVPAGGMPRAHELLIAGSAPLLNVALTLPLLLAGLPLLAGASFLLACCSLLPVPHPAQDGWRIIQAIRPRR